MKKVVRLTEADLALMVKQVLSEGGINEGFGRNIGVQMAIWSHLSDIEYDSPEQRKIRCNFIKLLVAKYIPNNVEVNEDKLDALYDQVSNRDFSGSALEDSEMSDMSEQKVGGPINGIRKGTYVGKSSINGKQYRISLIKCFDGGPCNAIVAPYGQVNAPSDEFEVGYGEDDRSFYVFNNPAMKSKYGFFKELRTSF